MTAPVTATDLIDQVRDQLDESNTETVSDSDVLQSLNRGQDYATDLMIRHYQDPLLAFSTTTTSSNADSYDMPEGIFEDRLQKVEMIENGVAWEVKRISYRDVTYYESSARTVRPMYYYVVGKKFYLVPDTIGGKTMRFWYLKDVEPLVEPQGRITSINTSDNYIILDSIGSDLTTVSDELKNYVNLVDAQTSNIKSSHQIQSIDSSANKITFKSTPDRSSVRNRSITGTISSEVEVDDYICLSSGNCVPYLVKPLSNYVIQYAVLELKRKLGEPTQAEERALQKLADQVESTWSAREHKKRVKKRSKNWQNLFRWNYNTD